MTVATRAPNQLQWIWWLAELLLVATSIAAAQLLQRLYADSTYLAPMLFTIVVGHVVLIAMRWLGFGAFLGALTSLLAVILAIVATHYADTAGAMIVPTATTLEVFQTDLIAARDVFDSMQAPVPAVTGFVVIGSLAFWALGLAADWAAFRLFAPGQALLPALTVLIFVSLLGLEHDRLRSTAILVVVGVLFVLAHRAAARASVGVWLDRGAARGYQALMIGGSILAVVAAGAGIVGGPSVPGADEEPLVDLGGDGPRENKPIEVVSPLVQIQARLTNQSNEILFTVESPRRAYWRIAALDVFDGTLWRSQGQFRSAEGDLDIAYPTSLISDHFAATFDLGSMNVVWAPAPYLPVEMQLFNDVAGLNYEAESATFIVDTKDQGVSNGIRYQVQAEAPSFTGQQLRALAPTSGLIDNRYLALPNDFSPLARQTAQQITSGIAHPYDQALALQNYFRSNFTYDVEVARGHDITRIEDFLAVQRGYCEQFAGTFAAMARSIGLPARVATGFTPGDTDPDNPNRFTVRGRHAHAWPEVWIAGAGWVAFEPTPGRGAPGAESYTGVPESQDDGADTPAPDTEQADLADEAAGALAAPTPTPGATEDIAAPEGEEAAAENLPIVGTNRFNRTSLTWLTVLLAIGAWALGVPALKRWYERRRQAALADDARRAITLAWSEVLDHLDRLGYPPTATETLHEYSRRMEFDVPASSPRLGELTDLTAAAAYGPDTPSPDQVDRAATLAESLHEVLDADQPWLVRSAWQVDPRPLLRFPDPVRRRAENLAGSGARSGAGSGAGSGR